MGTSASEEFLPHVKWTGYNQPLSLFMEAKPVRKEPTLTRTKGRLKKGWTGVGKHSLYSHLTSYRRGAYPSVLSIGRKRHIFYCYIELLVK